jgi:PAS domain S-box-containing protein
MEEDSNPHLKEKTLLPEFHRRIIKKHRSGAILRSGAAMIMWVFAFLAYEEEAIRWNHFEGISACIAYLVLINPPTLFLLKRLHSLQAVKQLSLAINFLEIPGYTGVMYFLGGIEASYLTPMYGILVSYVGIVAPRHFPLIVAGGCGIFYGCMVLMQYSGFLPAQTVIPGFQMPLINQLIVLATVIGLLLITAVASGYTATLLKKSRDLLRRQKEKLEERVRQRTAEVQDTNEILQNALALRQQAEESLRSSEERYRAIFETSFDVIYTVDPQFRLMSISPSIKNALGYDPEEMVGRPFVELGIVAPEYLETAFSDSLHILSGGTLRAAQYEFIAKDGSRRWGEVSGAPLKQDGKVVAWISIGRDITERKQAEDELRRARDELESRVLERTAELSHAREEAQAANRAKSEFLANMSHELRTPLNAIIGFSELMADGQAGEVNEIQQEYLGDVLKSSRHLLSLINDILDLSKVEAGKMELNLEKVRVKDLLAGSLGMVKEKAAKQGITLRYQTDELPDFLFADERKLKQILQSSGQCGEVHSQRRSHNPLRAFRFSRRESENRRAGKSPSLRSG